MLCNGVLCDVVFYFQYIAFIRTYNLFSFLFTSIQYSISSNNGSSCSNVRTKPSLVINFRRFCPIHPIKVSYIRRKSDYSLFSSSLSTLISVAGNGFSISSKQYVTGVNLRPSRVLRSSPTTTAFGMTEIFVPLMRQAVR